MSNLIVALYLSRLLSFQDLNFEGIYIQERPDSCGIEATKNFSVFYAVTIEDFILQSTDTISLMDIKMTLERNGINVIGYKLAWPSLIIRLKSGPILTHLLSDGGHFTVCVSINDDSVILADSKLGWYAMSITEFKRLWSGNSLVLASSSAHNVAPLVSRQVTRVSDRVAFLQTFGGMQ